MEKNPLNLKEKNIWDITTNEGKKSTIILKHNNKLSNKAINGGTNV